MIYTPIIQEAFDEINLDHTELIFDDACEVILDWAAMYVMTTEQYRKYLGGIQCK